MKIYKQRHQYDCFLASMATALQRDYDELWPVEFQQRIEANEGSGGVLYNEGLKIAGLTPGKDIWSNPVRFKLTYPTMLLDLFQGCRALLQVPSLNHPGKSHLIYLLRGEVFDPSNKKTYNHSTDIQTVEWVTTFNELDPQSPARWPQQD